MGKTVITLSQRMHQDIRIIAASEGISVESIGRQAIAEYLLNHYGIVSDLSVQSHWFEGLGLLLRQHELRAKKYKVESCKIMPSQLYTLFEAQDKKCAYCKNPLIKTLVIDHIKPFSQKGPHTIENICLCCRECNNSKGGRTPDQWTDRWYLRDK